MNKTITITLAGTLFYVEEQAFAKLDDYLKSIKTYFASYPESEEIVKDIESRIAEQFLAKGNRDRIVTEADVNELMNVMGRVEDFGYEGESRPQNTADTAATGVGGKKLMRSSEDKIIAGVCGGIAAYFGWDPVIVRVVFAITVFFGGYGILFYLLLWLAMPEAKTTSEKMQMRGEAVTLASFKETVKERAQELKSSQGAVKNAASGAARGFGRVIRILALAVAKLIGAAILIAAAFGFITLTFALVTVIFNINSPYVDFPIRELFSGVPFYVALFSAYFSVLIPLVFLVLAGSAILSNKLRFNKSIVLGLLVVWIIALITGGALATRYAPEIQDRYNSLPAYQTTSKQYFDLGTFDKVQISGANRMNVTRGDTFTIVAHGRQRDLDQLAVTVQNGSLSVGWPRNRVCIFCLDRSVTVDVTMPNLTGINVSGASRLDASGFSSTNFSAQLSGASRSTLDINTTGLTAELSGSSRMGVAGTADTVKLKASGASRLDAQSLKANTADVDLSGASQAHVNATGTITVNASGASRLYYQGGAQVRQSLSGASRVIVEGQDDMESFRYAPTAPDPVLDY